MNTSKPVTPIRSVLKKELTEVYLLRGVASMMVCLFHLILGNSALFPSTHWLEQTFSFGYLGVEVFFILSGYVICFSLPGDFKYTDLGTFFKKRVTRIEPPFIISIILVLVVNFLSHSITGIKNEFDVINLLFHLAYINNFFPDTYVNVVYWTLGIEFQFYVLIGLLFPLLTSSKPALFVTVFAFILLSCLAMPQGISVIIPYLSYFVIGIVIYFFKHRKMIHPVLSVVMLAISLIQIKVYQGSAPAVLSLATIFVLFFWKYTNNTIRFFSMISFSLYLIHVPIGGKVINLGLRFVNTSLEKYLLVTAALGISIAAAWVFYTLIEKPTFTLSKSIRYKRNPGGVDPNKMDERKTTSSPILSNP